MRKTLKQIDSLDRQVLTSWGLLPTLMLGFGIENLFQLQLSIWILLLPFATAIAQIGWYTHFNENEHPNLPSILKTVSKWKYVEMILQRTFLMCLWNFVPIYGQARSWSDLHIIPYCYIKQQDTGQALSQASSWMRGRRIQYLKSKLPFYAAYLATLVVESMLMLAFTGLQRVTIQLFAVLVLGSIAMASNAHTVLYLKKLNQYH